MSDAPRHLPPAAFDITAVRRAADDVPSPRRAGARAFGAFLVLAVVAIAAVVAAAITGGGADILVLIALGVVSIAVLFALVVVIPTRIARTRQENALDRAAETLAASARDLVEHMASLGYRVAESTALAWVSSPESTTTVPLVHDSVIAARWWRPEQGDDRVFVEPYLRAAAGDSSLPALPPI
ncbi:hypothetical protein [Marisediminicola sp. LYQ85]|uniref:hypothetical protein n=1 Tax=Marisediminicola sp. LYQ85 TaxID=3391062 RepID=UPI003983483B